MRLALEAVRSPDTVVEGNTSLGSVTVTGTFLGLVACVFDLGRALGPVWGNAALSRYGEAMPYLSAAACLVLTLLLSLSYTVADSDATLL